MITPLPTLLKTYLATLLILKTTANPVPPSIPNTFSFSGNDGDDEDTPLPLVIWHGLGDNYLADGLKSVGALADQIHPGTYVYNIHLADSANGDQQATFFGNLTTQLEQVCTDLSNDPILSTAPAIDAIGFSQGGQFLRGYVERCNSPRVRNLVTFGSQHNGISEFQHCGPTDFVCKGEEALLKGSTWTSFVQNRLIPAQYYRNPLDYDNYLLYSNFLADINNERDVKNKTYAENMAKLENFVMYLFADDTTVVPKESGWFAEVDGTEVTGLRDRALYKEDWLGLKELDGKGGLKFKTTDGGHMSLSSKLLSDVFKEFLGPQAKGKKTNKKKGKAAQKVGGEEMQIVMGKEYLWE